MKGITNLVYEKELQPWPLKRITNVHGFMGQKTPASKGNSFRKMY